MWDLTTSRETSECSPEITSGEYLMSVRHRTQPVYRFGNDGFDSLGETGSSASWESPLCRMDGVVLRLDTLGGRS
jgi:hypothetical protein